MVPVIRNGRILSLSDVYENAAVIVIRSGSVLCRFCPFYDGSRAL